MKYSFGNDKLGNRCLVVSRPVGDTCPNSCEFLGNGCYAEFTEKRFPNARKSAQTNVITDWQRIRSMLIFAKQHNYSVRWHERGDFLLNGKLDLAYVKSIKTACESLKELPVMWSYSHVFSKRLLDMLGNYITIYASVHNACDIRKAKRAGFKLFAWADTQGLVAPSKRGGNPEAPKTIKLCGEKFVTCPEMRRGRKAITCTGSDSTIPCKLCTNGLANVAFLEH